MLTVLPGQQQRFRNTKIEAKELELAIAEVGRVIRGTNPLVDEVIVTNKTKRVSVDIAFTGGKVHITITNPDDEKFSFD